MNTNIEDAIKQYIPLLSKTKSIEEIHKGYSSDRKFIVIMENPLDSKLILRMSDIAGYEAKKEEYYHLSKMPEYNVRTSKVVDFGRVEELNICYMLVNYIEGNEAADMLPQYSHNEQYQIGIEAGLELKKMHQYLAPSKIPEWYERKLRKQNYYYNEYCKTGYKVSNQDRIFKYIEKNVQFMNNRPNVFQHDDFHPSNIIVKDKKYSGVIDFNRYDWGDPLHDFIKVGFFSREVSVPFSIGQIVGYFPEGIPEYFWNLFGLYMAVSITSAIVWTLKYDENHLNEMHERVERIIEEHKGFELSKPTWFE